MKIALVTGASSGMGREFALMIPRLYKNLDEIWVTARRTERLKELQDKIKIPVRIFPGDLIKSAVYNHIRKALEAEKPEIRLLVNAAGYGKVGQYEDIDPEEQLGMIDLNCRALTKMTLLSLPYMGTGSRIIEVSSAAAFAPEPYLGTYASTKSYVYSFSRSLNYELKDRQISVTAVCPGPVDTEFFDRAGQLSEGIYQQWMAEPEKVVRKALLDAVERKPVSVYGMTMKLGQLAAKILPTSLVMKFTGAYSADRKDSL